MTLAEFRERLECPPARAYLTGKMMRQAKPDDVLQFVSPQEIADLWPMLEKYLGNSRDFWNWLMEEWVRRGIVRR